MMSTDIQSYRQPLFLQNLNAQIERHVSDESLDVKRLTRLVGMSRTDLHRKLNKTVGMSTTEYLRYFRLCNAAKLLLEQPYFSIYQVALEVGFSSQSYFSVRFKEVFGCCPMAYREQAMRLVHT